MSALAERAARRMAHRALDGLLEPHLSRHVEAMWPVLVEDAEEVIRETLAYLPEASVQAVYQAIGSTIMANGPEGEFRQLVGLFTRAVAREHGLDPPPAEEHRP